jgi:uncharacterized protein (DUF1697 family)
MPETKGNINVQGLIEDAIQALQEKAEATENVAALRELLRYSIKSKKANAAQKQWIMDTFPPVVRTRKNSAANTE